MGIPRISYIKLYNLFSTLQCRNLLQHHSSKESIFFRSACFTIQLSQPYVFIGKTIVLIILIFVFRLISLLLVNFSRFIIAFLPNIRLLFISTLQSPSLSTFEPRKMNSLIMSTCSLSMLKSWVDQFIVTKIFFKFSFKPAAALSAFTLI